MRACNLSIHIHIYMSWLIAPLSYYLSFNMECVLDILC